MEIKVHCQKEGDTWIIADPGKTYVRENRVVWRFEGLEPGVVPLIAFHDNPPHGPFPNAWITGTTIAAELVELPAHPTDYKYDIVLAQWNPDQSTIVRTLPHELTVEARPAVQIKVSWKGLGSRLLVEPDTCTVGGDCLVEWQFEIPDNVFATIDFGSPDRGAELRPQGPFAELHGRREEGMYRLTGQTDLVKDGYKYTVTLYDRESGQVIIREDPKIDNNGDPI